MRYSRLSQINPENVSKLKIAWVFHTGDVSDGKHGKQRSGFETTPILIDGMLFFTTGFNRVIAVNPETGKLLWAYDPKIDLTWDYGDALVNRSVATWFDPASTAQTSGLCRRRIYEASLDARLIALDAATGLPCTDFGDKGEVSLRDVPRYAPGRYHVTSPPTVIDNLVVVGSAINDNNRVDVPDGVVRVFDARTGALRWSWDPIEKKIKLSAAVTALRSGRPAPAMPGPLWPRIPIVTSSSFPQAAPVRIITVGCAPEMTSGRIQLSPFVERLEHWFGDSNWFTMISGTMTRHHRRYLRCCNEVESRFQL